MGLVRPGPPTDPLEDMISVIVFSKDRPLQLLGYLESLQYYSGLKEECIHVLYKTSDPISYDSLQERCPQICWIPEDNLKTDFEGLLKEAKDYILWGVDDIFFKSAFNISTCIDALKSNKELFGFSLRLGRNIQPHQELNKEKGYFVWDWTLARSIPWNFPWEMGATVYRKEDVLKYLKFSNTYKYSKDLLRPNYFEEELDAYFKEHKDIDKRYLACFEFSKCVILCINRVQETHPSEFDGRKNTDPLTLYNLFSQGYRLDWHRFKDCSNSKTHAGSAYYALRLNRVEVEKRSKRFHNDNLRILVFKPESGIGSYILHDCMEALKGLNHEVKGLLHDGPKSVSEERLTGEILNFQPDFILAYDHTGIRTDLLTRLKIPYASYFFEPPEFRWLGYEQISESLSPYYVLFMWDKSRVRAFKARGFEHVYFLPLAANPQRFQEILM